MTIPNFDKRTAKAELRQAARTLQEHGLIHAAKWVSEQALGLGPVGLPATTVSPPPELGEEEQDALLVAKAFFDVREYRRAAHVLTPFESSAALFIRGYSLFLAGERRKEEETVELAGPAGATAVINGELPELRRRLEKAYGEGRLDAFGLYLYGLVLKEQSMAEQARSVLAESVSAFPCNWSAWLDLAGLCDNWDVVRTLSLPNHFMQSFFSAHLDLELQRNKDALDKYNDLATVFAKSAYVRGQLATGRYNMRDFTEAQIVFEQLAKEEPHNLDCLDTFSNILYVKEGRSQLSFLAHNAMRTDKYRPETCCVVGNYYSLKAQHEKAVIFFRRALQLNPKYLSAWTLMGHEYVEMHKPKAAIAAYRSALDVNSRDYRAWYGLGQTYEILGLHFYSLYYFRKAASLRPYDARMWCAVGQCYEFLKRNQEAIKCYERALENEDREGIALDKLAKLYVALDDADQAAAHYERNLTQLDADEIVSQQTVDALSYLSHFYMRRGRLGEAEALCERLLEMETQDKEEAKSMLREIRQGRFPAGGGAREVGSPVAVLTDHFGP